MASDAYVRNLARQLVEIQQAQRQSASTPQLGTSSIEDGKIEEYDINGQLKQIIGKQRDGTNTTVQVNGPTPPAPTAPVVATDLLSMEVAWSGLWFDDVVAPLDFLRVDVHLLPDAETDPLTTRSTATIASQGWGSVSLPVAPGTYHVALVAWTTSGKYAVSELTGPVVVEQLEITETMIADGSISTPKLQANSVTVNELAAGTLEAGFVLTGRLQVGSAYWTPGEGLVIPQPDGGFIRLPADGLTPAQITAHLVARSLTVEGNLNITGANNKLSGQLVLSNGVTRPVVAPSLSATYPSVPTFDGLYGPTWYGVTPYLSDSSLMVVATAFFGGGVNLFNKVTGAPVAGPIGLAWGANNFNPVGGITSVAGSYYVFGQDQARSGDWYIYALDANFAKTGERLYALNANIAGRPVIGNDGANIMIAVPRTNDVVVDRFRADLGAGALANGRPANQAFSLNNLGSSPLAYIGEGAYDFGATKILIGVEGNRVFHFTSAGVRDDTYSFPVADGGRIRGLAYVDGAFRSLDTSARWATYSGFQSAATVTGSYSWYDGVGTVRETQCSLPASLALPARAWPRQQADAPPDNGVAGTGVDRANRVGIYMAVGAAARRLQTYLPVDGTTFIATREYRPATITTTGQTEPTTNGFIGSTAGSPGSIITATGTGAWSGDNSGKIGPITFTENLATVPYPDTALAIANRNFVETTIATAVGDTGWIDMSLDAGFVVVGGNTPQYLVEGDKVWTRGLVGRTGDFPAGSYKIITAPTPMRPVGQDFHGPVATDSNADCRMLVTKIGTTASITVVLAGSVSWISLDAHWRRD